MNFNNIKSQAMVEHLIMQGAIEMAGIDEKGEMLYSITDKLELVNPEIYAELTEQYKHHMFQMIKQGPKSMNWRLRV
jgi:hypothetical protein